MCRLMCMLLFINSQADGKLKEGAPPPLLMFREFTPSSNGMFFSYFLMCVPVAFDLLDKARDPALFMLP